MARNALRRTSDRVESLLVFLLVFAFLAGTPVLAWRAGQASYASDVRARQWEREHAFPVEAALTADAVVHETGTAAAPATWTTPGGTARSGNVPASTGDRAGDRVTVWVTEAGDLRSPPARRNPMRQAILTGVAVTLCLAAGCTGLYRISRGVLDRRRYRAWTREWLEVGPRWSNDRR